MSRKKIKVLMRLLIALVIFVLVAVAIIILGKNQIDTYKDNIDSLSTEIENNRQIVYVAGENEIIRGDLILAEGENANVMKQEIYSGLEPDYYITDDDLGTTAIVDIQPYAPIMKNMVTPLSITQDTREYEVSVVDLMIDQKQNDYIDIRIMFPNGEDYLVLPKKEIKNLVLNTSLFYTYLNEEEIVRLASATIDAYSMTGTKIYATRYVESNLQKEAIPNYLVRAETLDLMTSDPNLLTKAQETMNLSARMSLEQRLSGLTKEQLAAVSDGHGLTDTAKTSILTTMKIDMDKELNAVEEEENTETEETTETETESETEESKADNIDSLTKTGGKK